MTPVEEIRGDGDGGDTLVEITTEASVIEDAKKEIEDADEVNSLDLENAPLEEGTTPKDDSQLLDTVAEAVDTDEVTKDDGEVTESPGDGADPATGEAPVTTDATVDGDIAAGEAEQPEQATKEEQSPVIDPATGEVIQESSPVEESEPTPVEEEAAPEEPAPEEPAPEEPAPEEPVEDEPVEEAPVEDDAGGDDGGDE